MFVHVPKSTVLVLSKLKKINATALQPQRNVLNYFAIFKNVAHSLEPGSKLCTTFLNLAKNDEIISKHQFSGTPTQPQCNREFCQFNKDQYCITLIVLQRRKTQSIKQLHVEI